ncbi:uncharacterized protein LOC126824016 isoform X1 [Patella vulgata]|uniref:uncharacterized protein LOC126824016 isoform X1 n=1 Tax=Patella vulgata TaxID=6465 RepID=UPI0024A8C87D|nr:uncharacterized protein LOC126824016 isoform X1 [Patella vulgata]XP_050409072.2 uncharacterized protein LOC126824016 isoform X1 [Patella vulgata]XP_055957873.1 uncharacterized protein LOC126824016 isoform X1 [Patella vulgata]
MHGHSEIDSRLVKNLQVTDLTGTNIIDLPPVYTTSEIPVSSSKIPRPEIVKRWDYLQNILIPEYFPDIKVGLLIGTNCPKAQEPLKVIPSQNNGPYAVLTRLGWTIVGPINAETSTKMLDCNRVFIKDLNSNINGRQVSIDNQIHDIDTCKMFEHIVENDFTDYNCKDPAYSQEDKQFLHIVNTETKLVNGHYEIPLPFKDTNLNIPNNKELAYKRLQSSKNKMEPYPEYKHDYCDFISDLLNQRYAVKVPSEQLYVPDGQIWYVPHHGVYHPRKPDKLRVVYDCSAKWNGLSLNNCLLQGPDFANSLIGVLIRLREHPVAFMADVEKMFYQVSVPPKDWNYLRFLWWPNGNTTQRPEEYQMTVHIFGAVSSPSVANYALQKTADDNFLFGSKVIESIKRDFYVDDLLKSCETEQEAIDLANDIVHVCALGGFNLTKFTSSNRTFINSITEDKRAKNIKHLDINYDDLPVEHCLGVRWCVESDMFTFNILLKDKPFTTRGILSVVGSIYDPLGFLSPVTLVAKRILQELCSLKIGWDDAIPENSQQRWIKWRNQIFKLDQLKIERCLRPPDFGLVVKRGIHIFSDASSTGYGSVCYQRIVNDQGQIHCGFLIGKSRLAPLKQKTIPRLELSAATISVKLSIMLFNELDLAPHTVTFWTDSTTVLQYIRNESKRFHVFVANRISFIRSSTQLEQWKYVNTNTNPGDLASRTTTADNFVKDPRWLMGPEFLWTTEDTWPEQPKLSELSSDNPEVKREIATLATINTDINPVNKLIEHYSDWFRLKRSVAYMLRLKDLLRKRVKDINAVDQDIPAELAGAQRERYVRDKTLAIRNSHTPFKELNVEELNASENAIVKFVQFNSFPNEIQILKQNVQNNNRHKIVPRTSSLYRLDPIISEGLLRVGGRLRNADLSDNVKHPIILPRNEHFTNLIVNDIHRSVAHAGRGHTIAILRDRYWIINANSAVRNILSKCITCRKLRAPIMNQKMSDLPKDRVSSFYTSGRGLLWTIYCERRSQRA